MFLEILADRAMPLQNRVMPDGEIIAHPARGTLMGNRGGAFHRDDQTLGKRRWASRQWIACLLSFKNRHREVMQPRRYTELFFLDEATALAAGHRPCFECRRGDALAFAELWAQSRGHTERASAGAMDRILHEERLTAHNHKRTFRVALATLPPGAMVRWQGRAALVAGTTLRMWTPEGYAEEARPAPATILDVLTPRSMVEVIGRGYAPMLHETATRRR